MLGKGFLKINNETIPNPAEGFIPGYVEPLRNEMTAESGKRLVTAIRLDQRIFSGTWHLSSYWLEKFESYETAPYITLEYQGETYTCTAEGCAPKLADGSQYVAGTEGLWELSMTFTEL